MRIVLLTVDHMYANRVVRDVLGAYPNDVKLIVESETLLHKKSLPQSLYKYFKIAGSYYIFAQAVKLQLYKFLRMFSIKEGSLFGLKFYPFKKVAKRMHIPVKKVFNVNSPKNLAVIKRFKPDLVVSVLFNQILAEKILAMPKKGVINIHPAFLPDYKGISPVFWALSNSEKEVGISIHYINTGVDTGEILARKKLNVERNDTEDSLYWKLIKAGSPLLLSVIGKIKKGEKIRAVRNSGGRYFSIPDRAAVSKYLRKKKTFFRYNDILFQR